MAESSASPLPEPIVTPIARTATTWSGQPLRLPQGPAELVMVAVEIPVGGATDIHQHPWSRFAYVERGTLLVINHDTGERRQLAAGEMLSEAVGQWHEGRTVGDDPVRLIVIDLVPPGSANTTRQR